MAEFVRFPLASEGALPVVPIHGAFRSVQGCPKARNAVTVTTAVESLSGSSRPKLEIAGILSHDDLVHEGQGFTGTPMYLVDADKASHALCWSSTCVTHALQQLRDVSIPNNVRELCDHCFKECRSLCRVTFGSSPLLERIGSHCFAFSGIKEVSIPDSVRVLCECCF